ncbi:polyphosphate kinase 2 [Scleromatobacter humisilvae]|jgi:polyphosphate kinase 2|uniref:ADP/GDP-polyphosphate phosphotransferase n=1 Tax=Scleromatobacter humisilvae TaxID=2897159 RepID=A0A9X1YQ58_9BURK|nr:polyphosphate kinase 2 [Scleromatobacter humisilvae]MCK9688792.1 polyphosphate kinase 2 [Scleromatobacter humisilvae]
MSKDKKQKHGASYEDELVPMQVALNGVMRVLQDKGERVVVLFEGRDTAGKGGVIKAVSEKLNTRQCHIAALGVPTDREKGQWYFQRYVAYLPGAGEMTLFDRSWYNRAGVEAVMGFCTPAQTDAFLKAAPVFEKMLVDDGIRLFKYWLTVDQAEQEQRFADRQDDPLKQWKLSPVDLQARAKYDEYGRARDRMLEATHTKWAPWTLVDFNDQKAGRLKLIANLLSRLPVPADDAPEVEIPPLPGKPLKEKFRGPLKPI